MDLIYILICNTNFESEDCQHVFQESQTRSVFFSKIKQCIYLQMQVMYHFSQHKQLNVPFWG